MLIASGMPLLRALDILAQESGLPAAQRVLYRRLSEDLREGTPLSAAMENNSPAFPPLLAAAVRSAEGNGRLHEVCLRMAAYYEKEPPDRPAGAGQPALPGGPGRFWSWP